jgi:hypothetical protein
MCGRCVCFKVFLGGVEILTVFIARMKDDTRIKESR